MTELDKNTQFFSRLVVHRSLETHASFAERLKEAKSHERTLRRAIAAVVVLGLLSVAGVGYVVLFAPELEETAPIALKLFYITGLASLICLLGFQCFWLHTRSVRRRLIDECRRSILATIDPPHQAVSPLPPLTEDTRKVA